MTLASLADGVVPDESWHWWGIGVGVQLALASRSRAQWIASDRARDRVVPRSFWWLGIVVGSSGLCHAICRLESALLRGEFAGTAIYGPDLALIRQARAGGPG